MGQRHRRSAGLPRPLTLIAVTTGAILWTLNRIHSVNNLSDQGYFAKYTDLAQRALAGDLPLDRLGDVSTGYLWTIALLSGPLGLDPPAIRTLQIVLVTVAALVCGAAAWKRWGAGAGLATIGVIFLSRGALLNATEIEPETIILLLVSAALSLIVAHQGPATTAGVATLLGLTAVFRPSTLLPTVLVAIFAVLSAEPRSRIRTATTFFAGVATPLAVARGITFVLVGFWPPAMNPGTVFYEGCNPAATGYLGEAPAVVKNVEYGLGLPDGLHVAYRTVAARATGTEPSPAAANRFWAARSLAFIRDQPTAVIRLVARKGLFGLHSHDAWDLATQQRKSAELPQWPWLPFGFAVALAGLGAAWGRSTSGHASLVLFSVGGWTVMLLFYVTSRQRNVLLPAVALLVGLAVHEVVQRWGAESRRSVLVAVGLVLAIGFALTRAGPAQREDTHTWDLRFAAQRAFVEATSADAAGRLSDRDDALARAATFLDREALLAAPADLVRQHVSAELKTGPSPQRRFDLALVLVEIGRHAEAAALLEGLRADRYQPRRGARITSSVSFHLARCQLALGNRQDAMTSLKRALEEAPGEARTLALYALMLEDTDRRSAAASLRELTQIHDRFTARLATAHALLDLGHPDLAISTIIAVDTELEEGASSRALSW